MKQNKPKVSIIILNWNGWQDTLECLESVYRMDYPNFEVILVDNFSTNDSIQKIKDWVSGKIVVDSKYFDKTLCTHKIDICEYTKQELDDKSFYHKKTHFLSESNNKQLFLLKNDKNYGFAAGCNIPMRQVLFEGESQYVFLLNNDTFIEKSHLSELVDKISLNKYGDVGCIMGSIYQYGYDKYWIKKYNITSNYKKIDEMTGCGLMISLNALKELGLFDEYFFLYSEDYDLTLRISKKFDNIYIRTRNKIYHKCESSSNKIFNLKIKLQVRNQLIILKRFPKKIGYKATFKSLAIIFLNNYKISKIVTVKAFFSGLIIGIYEMIFNEGPKY